MALSDNIQRLRKIKKLSVQQLADAIGVKKQSVYDWEAAKYAPGQDNLDALAKALGVQVKVFFEENSTPVQNEPAVSGNPLG